MSDYVHPASPTALGLLKNLTEKIGTHTLFYDQKKQSKTTANNRHSFCRFCACAIWWSPQRRSNENSSKEWNNMLTQCGEQIYLRATSESQEQELGYTTLPRWVGMAEVFSEVSIRPLCCKQSQETSGVGRAGTAAAQPPRHSAAFGNSLCFYISCPLPRYLDCKRIQAETGFYSVLKHNITQQDRSHRWSS